MKRQDLEKMMVEGVRQASRDLPHIDSPYLMYDAGKVTCKLEHKGIRISLTTAKNLLELVRSKLEGHGMEYFSTVYAYGSMHLFYSRYDNLDIVV